MSGGHYDYDEWKIKDVAERCATDLASDPDPERPWIPKDPILAELVRTLGEELFGIVHAVDYHISGDSDIGDLTEFRRLAINKLEANVKAIKRMHFRAAIDEAARLAELKLKEKIDFNRFKNKTGRGIVKG